jgi:hypothetical protein
MTNVIQFNNNNESPFDSIKRFDANGQEYWSARDLMKVMGYVKWDRFTSSILTAKENMELAGDVITDHLTATEKMVKRAQGGGLNQDDYKLSRYAAYHTALACDGRKPEVALAKKYFVVKTRQAETVIPAQTLEIEKLKLQLEIAKYTAIAEDCKKHILDTSQFIVQVHGAGMLALIQGNPTAVVEVKSEPEFKEIVVKNRQTEAYSGKSLASLAKELGFKTGTQLKQWLQEIERSDLISEGIRIIPFEYVQSGKISEIKKVFAEYRTKSGRQILLGES